MIRHKHDLIFLSGEGIEQHGRIYRFFCRKCEKKMSIAKWYFWNG